jgi:hypothetical protein
MRAVPLHYEVVQPVSPHRWAEEIALQTVTTFTLEPGSLLRCLHALGRDAHIEAVRQGDDRADNGLAFAVPKEILYKILVDLDVIERKILKVTQGGVFCPKIIE